MKLFLNFILSILLTSTAYAGLPPTTLFGQQQTGTAPTTFFFRTPNSQSTKLNGITSRIETGNYNTLENPSFEAGVVGQGWTLNGSLSFINSTDSVDGAKSLATTLPLGAAGTTEIFSQTRTLTTNMLGQNMQAAIQVEIGLLPNPTDLTMNFCVDIAGVNYQCVPIRTQGFNSFSFTPYSISFPGAAANTTYKFYVTYSRSGAAVGTGVSFDDAYLGIAKNISGLTPNNVFSAKISASGVISDSNQGGWISGCSGARPFTCTLSGFTVTPNCTVTVSPTSAVVAAEVTAISATSITIDTFITNTGAGSGAPTAIVCTKAAQDFIQPAITANQINFVNEFSAKISSAGVVSDENFDFINGNCSVSGTSIYTCTWNTSLFSVTPSCVATPLNTGGLGAQVRAQSTTSADINTFLTSSLANTASAFNLVCTRAGSDAKNPVQAPLLVGSITTNNQTQAFRTIQFTATIPNATTCTIGSNPNGDVTTCTASGGTATATFNGAFSAAPICSISLKRNSATLGWPAIETNTSSQIGFDEFTTTSSTATTGNAFHITCIGPR